MPAQQRLQGPRELTVKLTTGSIIVLLAAAVIAAFFQFPAWRTETAFVATVLGAAAAIYSAYYAGFQMSLNLHRDRQKQAYQILDSFNHADTVNVRIVIERDVTPDMSPNLAYSAINADPKKHGEVRLLLGILEDMAIAIQTGYADELVLYRSMQSAVQFYFDHLKPYIDGLRTTRTNPLLYCELELLVGSWRSSRSITTGKEIHA